VVHSSGVPVTDSSEEISLVEESAVAEPTTHDDVQTPFNVEQRPGFSSACFAKSGIKLKHAGLADQLDKETVNPGNEDTSGQKVFPY